MEPVITHFLNLFQYEAVGEGSYKIKRIQSILKLIQKGEIIELGKTVKNCLYYFAHGPVYISKQLHYDDAKRRYRDLDIPEGTGFANVRLSMCDHTGTHIDALNHVSEKGKLFGGIDIKTMRADVDGYKDLDITTIPPIITRAIFFDVSDIGLEREVTSEDLQKRLKVNVEKGDAAIIYTGFSKDGAEEEPGIGLDAAKWLVSKGFGLVGSDSPRTEYVRKGSKSYLPVHRYLIAENGIPIIDNMYLEALAKLLGGKQEFVLIVLPLRLSGATASPLNPIALL
jgi:kynurenine formamidase